METTNKGSSEKDAASSKAEEKIKRLSSTKGRITTTNHSTVQCRVGGALILGFRMASDEVSPRGKGRTPQRR